MIAVVLLLLIDPVLGLQCSKSKCFLNRAEQSFCYPPQLQSTTVECSHTSQCALRRKITTFSWEEATLADVASFEGSGMQVGSRVGSHSQSENSITYERDCVSNKSDCNGGWKCVVAGETRSCRETLCCSSSMCNTDANFSIPLSDSLLTRLSDGQLGDVVYLSTAATSDNIGSSDVSASPAGVNAAVRMADSLIALLLSIFLVVMFAC
ncbi:uncharacterized protein LOC134187950 [Corticium candelabrum]|uniref:uncharacterized protein LOC134187950 n=1 Tax=Corticium candelabrum TaxID=121492 RepID=UPI002E25F81A|nr:uncharacterized protein LOC134187950 [Corticium candelabrum]